MVSTSAISKESHLHGDSRKLADEDAKCGVFSSAVEGRR